MEQFSSKTMSEVYDLKFDFTDYLSDSDEIVYASTEVKILKGRDAQYKNLLYGNTLQKGNIIHQRVQGGKVGTTYKITATVETAKRQVLKLSGSLEITPDHAVEDDVPMVIEAVEPIIEEVKEQETIAELEAVLTPIKSATPVEKKVFQFKPTEVKEITVDGIKYGRIAGYASTFGNLDRVGDVVVAGAFKKSIEEFKSEARPVRMLYQHDSSDLIGGFIPHSMFEDSNGLFVEGDINLSVQKGAEAYALAKQGVLTDMSIGYSVEDFELKDGIRYLTDIRLWEISLVTEPANPKAKITAVKTVDELRDALKKKSDFERVLRDAGFSRSSAKFMASLVDNNKLTDVQSEGDVMEEKSEELRDEVLADASPEETEIKDVVINVEVSDPADDSEEDPVEDPEQEPEADMEEKPAPDQTAMEILLALRELLAKI